MPSRIGVCSWSLQPESPQALLTALNRLGVRRCQLALVPCVDDDSWADAPVILRDGGIEVVSGMLATLGEDYSTLETIRKTGGVSSDEHWMKNIEQAERTAHYAATHGIDLVTFHAGFLPDSASDPRRAILLDRLRRVSQLFQDQSLQLGFETGQESAHTLLEVLEELNAPNVGVNFDPANMILYGMGDPVDAVRQLLEHVVQVHIKDAIPTDTPGTWGTEVAVGSGAVDWPAFFRVLAQDCPGVDLVIEREAGSDRERDIATARDLISKYLETGAAT